MGESAGSDAGQQRFAALKSANRVRLARAELKRKIRTGQLSAAQILHESPWPVQRMPVSEVLMSQKRWGIQRCRRVLIPIGIPENKPVGTLTDRQRVALVAVLGGVSDGGGDPGAGAGDRRVTPDPPPSLAAERELSVA